MEAKETTPNLNPKRILNHLWGIICFLFKEALQLSANGTCRVKSDAPNQCCTPAWTALRVLGESLGLAWHPLGQLAGPRGDPPAAAAGDPRASSESRE